MKITLFHSPIDDPTMPYHATAYLKGHLHREGFTDVDTRDVNIEFVDYCLREDTVRTFYAKMDARIAELDARPELTSIEQCQYFELQAIRRHTPEQLRTATRTMRNPETFTDFEVYQEAVRMIRDYFLCLGALSYPSAIFDFRFTSRGNFSTSSLDDLLDPALGDITCLPVKHYFEQVLRHDTGLEQSDIIGISIVYDHQLMPAVWLSRAIHKHWPHKRIVLGGTGISNFYKYLNDKSLMRRFFDICDIIVVADGESAITEIAHAGGDPAKLRNGTNTITYDAELDRLYLPQSIHYEDVSKLAKPIYSSPWDLYLSPARGINYSPTRGCYWNRCTFCDYGLNTDGPTAPWRERRLDQVIEDLTSAIRDNGVTFVYFAVDVMAPGYLERLSDRIVEAGLKFNWSAELRMEKIFSPERCRKMAEAGCVCVSFGTESGNQRILDLIDKGTKVQYMSETMKNFAEAGIAVQLMTFHGFPTETPEEKASTIQFIRDNDAYWSTGGFGEFQLTTNAIIAKKPEKFSIELVHIKGTDAPRIHAFNILNPSVPSTVSSGGCGTAGAACGTSMPQPAPARLTEDLDASFHAHGDLFPPTNGRPWAGGTDTLHSMIYYKHHGRRFFRVHYAEWRKAGTPPTTDFSGRRLQIQAKLAAVPFDIAQLVAARRSRSAHVQGMLKEHQEPTWSDMLDYAGRSPRVRRGIAKQWMILGSKYMPLDPTAADWFQKHRSSAEPLSNLIGREPVDTQLRLTAYINRLERAGLVSLSEAAAQSPATY